MKKGMYNFLVSLSCFTFCMSFFIVPVKAESSIYYPDPDSYSIYHYFFNHGYNHLMLSSTDNITYNVSLDNIGTNNGSISGTDGLSGSSHETGSVGTNGSASLGSKYMRCTTNNAVSGTQEYSCYFSSSSYGVSNSQSINIQMNENTYEDYGNVDINVNESINQRINTDITGTITASEGSYDYSYLPWLNGTYVADTSVTNDNLLILRDNPDGAIYFIFYTKEIILAANRTISFLPLGGSQSATPKYEWYYETIGGLYMHRIKLYSENGSGYFTPIINGLGSKSVLPIYYGSYSYMPDKFATIARLRSPVGYILENGNSYTSGVVNDANNVNNQVSQKIGQFDNIENNSVNDMNNKISNLNLTSDILSNSKFLSSAQWVKTQFDRMTVSTPIGSVLSFSLILGMTLIFLGKIR